MNKKILIADDEIQLLDLLVDTFTKNDFDVLSSTDGEKALSIALSQKPDIILLDIRLPKLNGMEVLQSLRQDPWGHHVPIIMLTNIDADDQIMSGVVEDQPAYYLMKNNCQMSDIVTKVKEVLKMT